MKVLLGLGSNIEPARNIPLALEALAGVGSVEVVSRVWETPPFGTDGPPFHNCAAVVETGFTLERLREALAALEAKLGRVKTRDKYARRPIDIDLLAVRAGQWVVVERHLAGQPFHLHPLAELLPDLRLRSGETVASAVAERPLAGARPWKGPLGPQPPD